MAQMLTATLYGRNMKSVCRLVYSVKSVKNVILGVMKRYMFMRAEGERGERRVEMLEHLNTDEPNWFIYPACDLAGTAV